MAEARVTLAIEGRIATVTLDHGAKLNALTTKMLDQLDAAARDIERDGEVRVVLLTGTGDKAFCAGADIAAWSDLDPLTMGRRWIRDGHRIFDAWAQLRQPVIAVLNGMALGGGFELAATADLRIAEPHVRIGLPETRVGTIPGWSGTQRLVRRFGAPAIKRLALTGELIEAPVALGLGLITEIAPAGQAMLRGRELAAQIGSRAPVAVELAKQLINAAEGEDRGAVLEGMASAVTRYTEDGAEGLASFRDKREPDFRNR